tara:strand:- start:200 stop:361 length:162 start_codon:yes stop_codon:yes gene_type:complete
MSRWDNDMREISRIQFHTDYSRTKKNRLISKIEKRMAREEQLELDGKGTGYYQ